MKQLKLIDLTLENFKGPSPSPDSTWTGTYTLVPDGEDVKLVGENAAGKSAIFDAFLWLIFGEDSRRQSQFDVKPTQNKDRETSVTGKFEFDGERFTINRSYGDNYSYGVDGVPRKKSEFDEFLEEKFDLERLRILVDTRYFNEGIHWQSRRELLMNLVKGIETEDIIETKSELEDLDLKGLDPEDRRDQLKAEIDDLEEEKKNIPVQIKTLQENAPEFEEEPDDWEEFVEKLKAEKEGLVETKKDLEEEIADLKSSGRQAELRRKKNEIEADMDEFEREWKSEYEEGIEEAEEKRKKRLQEFHQVKRNIDELKDEEERAENQIEEIEDELKELRESYNETEECPLCGHEITEGEEEDFKKSVQLRGKEKRNKQETLKEEVEQLDSKIVKLQNKKDDLEEELDTVDKRIENLKEDRDKFDTQDKYQELQEERMEIVEKLENEDQGPSDKLKQKKEQLEELESEIDEQNQAIAQAKEYRRTLSKVGELKAKESKLAGKLETLKNQKRLVNEFVKTKAEILEESINSKFDLVDFKLFEPYKSKDGVKEVCETTVDSVGWDTLNNAGRIEAGLDIIKTFNKEWDLKTCVWIDGRESITELPEIDNQLIELVVSSEHDKLEVVENG